MRLGDFIRRICGDSLMKCEVTGCVKEKMRHTWIYTHGGGRVSVFINKIGQENLNADDDNANQSASIFMWTECKACHAKSERMMMSNMTYQYSFGEYFDLLKI